MITWYTLPLPRAGEYRSLVLDIPGTTESIRFQRAYGGPFSVVAAEQSFLSHWGGLGVSPISRFRPLLEVQPHDFFVAVPTVPLAGFHIDAWSSTGFGQKPRACSWSNQAGIGLGNPDDAHLPWSQESSEFTFVPFWPQSPQPGAQLVRLFGHWDTVLNVQGPNNFVWGNIQVGIES